MDSILPDRLLAFVRRAIWLQVAFQASQSLQGQEKNKKKENKGSQKKGSKKKRKRGFLWQNLTLLEMQPGAKLRRISIGRYFAATRTQRFRFRILRRTRSFPWRTSARSLHPFRKPPLKRELGLLCKETCSAVLCKEACSEEESALQRSVLCRGERSAKKRALQRRVLCRGECSAKKRALQRRVLCKGECSAKESALQTSMLCKGECSAKESALQSRVLCKEACSAKESALQRRVLCKGECSVFTAPEADSPKLTHLFL